MATFATTALLLAATSGAGPSAADPPAPSAPSAAGHPWLLRSVATDPSGGVWAVGMDETTPGFGSALVLRPTGDTWAVDEPASDTTQLEVVAPSAADDVWAAGRDEADRSGAPFLEHWDGRNWAQSEAPLQKLPEVGIFDLAAVAPDDVYATGRAGDESGTFRPVHLHWNGHAWRNDGRVMAGVLAVSASGPDDAWGVGRTKASATLVQHWDGNAWSHVESPEHPDGVFKVDAITPDDAWAIGAFGTPFIEHWDGSSWAVIPGPGDLGADTQLTDVGGSSATDVWITGAQPAGVVEHWDGTSWARVSTPADDRPGASLTSVTVTSSTDAWIAGTWSTYKHHQTVVHPILMHWDGAAWTLAELPRT